jgi:hypothetical protein
MNDNTKIKRVIQPHVLNNFHWCVVHITAEEEVVKPLEPASDGQVVQGKLVLKVCYS